MRVTSVVLSIAGALAIVVACNGEPYRYRGDAYIEHDGMMRRTNDVVGMVDVEGRIAEIAIFENGDDQGVGEIFRLTGLDANCNSQLCFLRTPADSEMWGGAALYFDTAFGPHYAWFTGIDNLNRRWLVYETVPDEPVNVPEPYAFWLMLLGVAIVVLVNRPRRKPHVTDEN